MAKIASKLFYSLNCQVYCVLESKPNKLAINLPDRTNILRNPFVYIFEILMEYRKATQTKGNTNYQF